MAGDRMMGFRPDLDWMHGTGREHGSLFVSTYLFQAAPETAHRFLEPLTNATGLDGALITRCSGHSYMDLLDGEIDAFMSFGPAKPWDHLVGTAMCRAAGIQSGTLDGRYYGVDNMWDCTDLITGREAAATLADNLVMAASGERSSGPTGHCA